LVEILCDQELVDHPAVDILVNNAGRSIRRSVALSYDRFHDYERTIQLNYLGTIKLIMGLPSHMRERKSGLIVNVSSIGVQTNPPRFSAYFASKAALDAWTRVVGSECIGDNVHFTTIHMPLVRTPMIAPTKIYDSFPTISPEEAADLICEATRAKPKQINTRLGRSARSHTRCSPRRSTRSSRRPTRSSLDSGPAKGQKGPRGAGLERAGGARAPDARRALVARTIRPHEQRRRRHCAPRPGRARRARMHQRHSNRTEYRRPDAAPPSPATGLLPERMGARSSSRQTHHTRR
jgi:NAD(P)-dependent dehydrogenase (short-subunit alcohol dehydrogenase family)